MPPRQRTCQRGAAPAGPALPRTTNILDLPNDLLVRCLAPLTQQERFESAALACKRFHQACLAPALLHTLVLTQSSQSSQTGSSINRRLGSLLDFLSGPHAVHMRCLHLGATGSVLLYPDADSRTETVALQMACLAACSGLALEELQVWSRIEQPSLGYLPSLNSLRRLLLSTRDREDVYDEPELLPLPTGISRLAALEELELKGPRVRCQGPSLAPALTRLYIDDTESDQLPRQLTGLGALVELRLRCDSLPEHSLAQLASLTSLRQLAWESSARVPASLSQLTQLEVLSVEGIHTGIPWGNHAAAALEAALPALQQLTTLSLAYQALPEQLPRSLASLPRLKHLSIDVARVPDYPRDPKPLPAGPWVSSLRMLGAPLCVLCLSTELLRSASRLEHLACLGPPVPFGSPADAPAHMRAFFGFLASHPPLRCFSIESHSDDFFPREFVAAMCRLHRFRPGLLWRHAKDGSFSKHILQDPVTPTDPGDECLRPHNL